MLTLLLVGALFGAEPAKPTVAQLVAPPADCAARGAEAAALVAKMCETEAGPGVIDEDVDVFLRGGNSFLGKVFQKLDSEGKLSEVLTHVNRSRTAWREGKATPRAPGH